MPEEVKDKVTVGLTVGLSVYTWVLTFLPAVVVGYWLIGRDAWPRGLGRSQCSQPDQEQGEPEPAGERHESFDAVHKWENAGGLERVDTRRIMIVCL